MPSFIIWNVWKERNKGIFKEEKNSSLHLLERILKQLKKTVSTIVRVLPKNPPSKAELTFLRKLGMQGFIPQGLDTKITMREMVKDSWNPPQEGYLKYNIDGASKGSSGLAGFRGVLWDVSRSIISLFYGHLGNTTNNMEELMALELCLEFLKHDHYQNVIIESNLELVIDVAKRISHGIGMVKVTKHWRLI